MPKHDAPVVEDGWALSLAIPGDPLAVGPASPPIALAGSVAEAMRTAAQVSGRSRRSRPATLILAGLVPLVDLVAVVGGLVVLYGSGRWTLAYGLAVSVMLACGTRDGTRLDPSVGDDVPGLVRSVAVPLLLVAPFLARSDAGPTVLRNAPVLVLILCAGRLIAYAILQEIRMRGGLTEDVLIVGAGQLGQGLAEAFLSESRYGLRPVGFVEDDPYDRLPLPVLGTTDRLGPILDAVGARRVVVAFGSASDASMVSVLRACDRAKVTVYVLPRFFELGLAAHHPDVDEVRGVPIVRLRRRALRLSSRAIKRSFDVVASAATLIVAAPVIAAVALAVRASSPGPVLFRQRRLGRNGRQFDLLKFRSMEVNADSDTTWGVASDPRVTYVGSFLRRTSLDELPQLWNVLRGDMSIVGPRPERPHFAEIFGGSVRGYSDRHRVAVGVTGWSQIHGLRGDTSIADRAMFDNYYVEHWSLWLDMRIIARTVREMVSPRLTSS